jgi:hypothetical protein|tara:strand:+ start:57 stop:536 length:480 start_codon:yes stop_codon:yes gene_type:complete
MLRLLLDANIYGEFIDEEGNEEIAKRIEDLKKEEKILIHNFKVIRDELRNARAIKTLNLYDKLTANTIHTPDGKVEDLADLYFNNYKEKGGIQSKTQNFMNDLRIIAFASIKGLDIVCSEDVKAFHTKLIQDTYKQINRRFPYRTPDIISLADLKKAWL